MFSQGRRHPVPLITGVTADESTIFLPLIMPQFTSPADYQRSLKATFGENAAEIERLLPVRSSADLWPRLNQLISAKWFGAWANYLASHGPGHPAASLVLPVHPPGPQMGYRGAGG